MDTHYSLKKMLFTQPINAMVFTQKWIPKLSHVFQTAKCYTKISTTSIRELKSVYILFVHTCGGKRYNRSTVPCWDRVNTYRIHVTVCRHMGKWNMTSSKSRGYKLEKISKLVLGIDIASNNHLRKLQGV